MSYWFRNSTNTNFTSLENIVREAVPKKVIVTMGTQTCFLHLLYTKLPSIRPIKHIEVKKI